MKNLLPRNLKLSTILCAVFLIAGIGLGLLWGWVIAPVEWTDVDPSHMSDQYKEEYFRMTIDSYRLTFNEEQAKQRLGEINADVESLYAKVAATPGSIDPNFLLVFGKFLTDNGYLASAQPIQMAEQTENAGGNEATTVIETEEAKNSGWVTVLVIIASLFAVGVAGYAIYRILKNRSRSFDDEEDEEEYEEVHHSSNRNFATPKERNMVTPQKEKTQVHDPEFDRQPFAKFQATYLIGNDNFNESFSIDSRSGEYLGECGFGVSELMGVGTPKKASAFEVWMFDKNDIQTVTKVLLTPYFFNDYNTRARLEPKGELVEVKAGKQIRLETASLFMIATIKDMRFGEGISAENSYLDQLGMELAIWKK